MLQQGSETQIRWHAEGGLPPGWRLNHTDTRLLPLVPDFPNVPQGVGPLSWRGAEARSVGSLKSPPVCREGALCSLPFSRPRCPLVIELALPGEGRWACDRKGDLCSPHELRLGAHTRVLTSVENDQLRDSYAELGGYFLGGLIVDGRVVYSSPLLSPPIVGIGTHLALARGSRNLFWCGCQRILPTSVGDVERRPHARLASGHTTCEPTLFIPVPLLDARIGHTLATGVSRTTNPRLQASLALQAR
jgi:hypothetical protein